VQQGGHGDPVLVLLHGLGATGDVWNGWSPVLTRTWPGRWLAPDLSGHGGSPPLPAYTFAGFASAVAELLDPDRPTVVLGHSLGGAVGLALAARAPHVRGVAGLGIKVEWTEEELLRATALASRPVAWFGTREEAAARHLRVAGLAGLMDPDDPAVDAGLVRRDGSWRLALDPAAFAVGAPDMRALLDATSAAVTLARGEHDPMNSDEQLARLGAPTATLAGLGHNAHVENPEATSVLLDAFH
jgi:pimeloyl-ACP methyl ester carboxylesterase